MTDKFTPGPWVADGEIVRSNDGVSIASVLNIAWPYGKKPENVQANTALISAAPELLLALEECVDLSWNQDSHVAKFDGTVMFGIGYDFSGIDGWEREEFLAKYDCVVWPSGGSNAKWSAYCTYDGSMWFEQFDTVQDAKEQCMKLLDVVLPDHPAMKARAAIAKARGL